MDYKIIPAHEDYVPYIPGYNFLEQKGKTFIYICDEKVRDNFKRAEGQINRKTEFGDFIYNLARDGPADWVEVGTWNGLGSTKCILDGFAERTDNPRLATYEADPLMFGVATENLHAHPAARCAQFIQNKLAHPSGFIDHPLIIPESDKKDEHYIYHYDRERVLYIYSKGEAAPFAPQVVLLDGGLYSGYADWLNVDKSRLMYVLLDDITCVKNKAVYDELLKDRAWICVKTSHERNGWAAFKLSQMTTD